MKFMRLGSKLDCFTTVGNITTAVAELESDIVLDVDGHKFHLHLFPLLAKCGALGKLVTEAVEAGEDEVRIEDFPGSAACFEKCAKFCYGVLTTLNAHNVSEVRCGAEFLTMSEMVEKGNLIYKLEVFLNTSILRGWRDSIICLQSSKNYLPWSEDLKIIDRCIESISSKVMVDPAKVDWSFSYTKEANNCMAIDHVSVSQSTSPAVWNGVQGCPWLCPVPNDWWVQDLSDLDIDLFWRVMVAVKAKNVASDLVGEALRVYALRWLIPEGSELEPHTVVTKESTTKLDYRHHQQQDRQLLETIISLLPAEKGSASCSFLLRILKTAITLNVTSVALKANLARRIGLQLEEASVGDLLLPSPHGELLWYDVDMVVRIVEHYLLQNQSPPVSPQYESRVWGSSKLEKRRSFSAGHIDFTDSRRSTATTHASKLKVAKLIDGYLAEVARDPNLPLGKFMQLAELVPDFARPFHDGLYRAVDMYLKEHPELPKGERQKVLFFEQVRTAATGGFLPSDMPSNICALVGQDSSDELSVSDRHPSMSTLPGALGWYPDFSTMKPGDMVSLDNRMIASGAMADCRSLSTRPLQPSKPKGLFSKSKKFLQKLFSKKVSNSASSRESEPQSFSMSTSRRQRHSIT